MKIKGINGIDREIDLPENLKGMIEKYRKLNRIRLRIYEIKCRSKIPIDENGRMKIELIQNIKRDIRKDIELELIPMGYKLNIKDGSIRSLKWIGYSIG